MASEAHFLLYRLIGARKACSEEAYVLGAADVPPRQGTTVERASTGRTRTDACTWGSRFYLFDTVPWGYRAIHTGRGRCLL